MNVRSYAINNHMNGPSFDNAGVVFKNLDQIRPPGKFFVFIDESLSTINDALFRVDVAPDTSISDKPAEYHSRGGRISFADGHVETRLWSDFGPEDLKWLKEHTTVLK